MTAWDLDGVVRFVEKGMGGNTLQTWHNKFSGTSISKKYKGKEKFKVTTTAAGALLTWEILKTGLCLIACLESGFLYWCIGVVVTFATFTSGTETVLTERLDKTTLNTLRRTLTAHWLKWVTEALQIVWFTETWTHSFLAPREEF